MLGFAEGGSVFAGLAFLGLVSSGRAFCLSPLVFWLGAFCHSPLGRGVRGFLPVSPGLLRVEGYSL